MIAEQKVVHTDACGSPVTVPKWVNTNDLTMKPARNPQDSREMIVAGRGAHIGIQTGDISGKVGATLIELGRNAREWDAVSQITDLDVSVDIRMFPARSPSRTRKNRRKHHVVASFDDRSVENELLRVIREVLEDGGLTNLNQVCSIRLFFEIIVPDDLREGGRHAVRLLLNDATRVA